MVESELREQLETELIIDFHNSVEIGSRVRSLRYVVVSCARYVRNTQSEPSNFDNFQVDQQKGCSLLLSFVPIEDAAVNAGTAERLV